jgi:hypothetical protein
VTATRRAGTLDPRGSFCIKTLIYRYVLWKKKWEAKGFGMTLKGPLDFALKDFTAAETQSFEPIYGTKIN